MKKTCVTLLVMCIFLSAYRSVESPAAAGEKEKSAFARENLVAWCVVPFDAGHRGPAARAAMLKRLGIRRLAYDWRAKHVPSFEREIVELKKHGIAYFAFWGSHDGAFALFRKHGIRPQVWKTLPGPQAQTREQRIAAAGRRMLPLVRKTAALGCRLGLYNHGGWGGEPENMVAVCAWLRKNAGADHVGIVWNFHHGHGRIQDFEDVLALMKPYLLCINLNGMNDNATPKILPVGAGEHEKDMIRVILESGYAGPIGILDHRPALDAEKSLKENLDGLKRLLEELGETAAAQTYE